MTFENYDAHQTYDVYTFANLSTMYWPTLNCSTPKNLSTVTQLFSELVNQALGIGNASVGPRRVVDGFEIVHKGSTDVRVKADPVEGVANESQGYVLSPGVTWSPPFRLNNYVTVYTSSNVSELLQISIGATL